MNVQPSPIDAHALLRSNATRWAAVLGVLLVALAVTPGIVVAQRDDPDPATVVTWGISPSAADRRETRSSIDHVIEPGATVVEHVVIDNFGDAPVALDLYASDARPANGAFDVTAADEPTDAVGSWIELTQSAVEIGARDFVIVPMTIRVPGDATPGDYAGGVLASRRSVGAGADVGIETERRVGTRVHLRVAGPIRPELTVDELTATFHATRNPLGRGTLDVSYRVANTGNVRLSGTTAVTMRGPFGVGERTVTGPVLDDLLPGHWIDHRVSVDGTAPLLRYSIDVVVEPTHSIGQRLDGAVEPASATTTVRTVPYATILLALVLVAAAWAWRRRRRRRSTTARRAADGPTGTDATGTGATGTDAIRADGTGTGATGDGVLGLSEGDQARSPEPASS